MTKSKRVEIELDYEFRPSHRPLWEFPEPLRRSLLEGRLDLVIRRDTSPNCAGLVGKDAELPCWRRRGEGFLRLSNMPSLGAFTLKEESKQRKDYGELKERPGFSEMSCFADQDRPMWSRYRIDDKKVRALAKRREQAERCAGWFNAQAGTARVPMSKLSSKALIVLMRSAPGLYVRAWMYRSLADAVLELVRGGFGLVNPDGFFEPTVGCMEDANTFLMARNVQVVRTNPPHIQVRLDLQANPHLKNASLKGQAPKLQYQF